MAWAGEADGGAERFGRRETMKWRLLSEEFPKAGNPVWLYHGNGDLHGPFYCGKGDEHYFIGGGNDLYTLSFDGSAEDCRVWWCYQKELNLPEGNEDADKTDK